MTEKGLRATVYYNKSYRGCAAGGLSERAESVVIVGTVDHVYPADLSKREVRPLPPESQVFTPTDDAPAVVLVYRNMGDTRLVHAEPAEPVGEGMVGYMSGGSYIGSCDSRFRELVGFYGAVDMHDRCETPAQYAALSGD